MSALRCSRDCRAGWRNVTTIRTGNGSLTTAQCQGCMEHVESTGGVSVTGPISGGMTQIITRRAGKS